MPPGTLDNAAEALKSYGRNGSVVNTEKPIRFPQCRRCAVFKKAFLTNTSLTRRWHSCRWQRQKHRANRAKACAKYRPASQLDGMLSISLRIVSISGESVRAQNHRQPGGVKSTSPRTRWRRGIWLRKKSRFFCVNKISPEAIRGRRRQKESKKTKGKGHFCRNFVRANKYASGNCNNRGQQHNQQANNKELAII